MQKLEFINLKDVSYTQPIWVSLSYRTVYPIHTVTDNVMSVQLLSTHESLHQNVFGINLVQLFLFGFWNSIYSVT